MAKLIKREQASPEEEARRQETQPAAELPTRRHAVIDRDTFEAKHEASSIRDQAQAQATEIVQTAKTEAQGLLEEAKAQAERLRAEAHAEGLAAGKAEGAAHFVALCAQVSARGAQAEAELAPHVAQLAMAVARRVLGRELQFSPELVVDMVKKTLGDKARQRREVTLRVHPTDAVHLREHRAQLAEVLSRTKEVRIVEDEAVPAHGVVIETEAGLIDAQLDTQLDAIEHALEAVR